MQRVYPQHNLQLSVKHSVVEINSRQIIQFEFSIIANFQIFKLNIFTNYGAV